MELGNRCNCDQFLQACEDDDQTTVLASIARSPDIVWATNQHGQSGIHFACENENPRIVRELVRANPDLCALKDGHQITPLHVATTKGNVEIIVAILRSRPESVADVTSLGETVLHLATKHHRIDAFRVLLDQTLKSKLDHLLHKKDFEGHNVLHHAVQEKQVEIVELLVGKNPKRCPLVRLDSRNGRGLTAFELHCGTDHQDNDKFIALLLHGATTCSVVEPVLAVNPNTNEEEEDATCCSHFSVLDALLGIVMAATYTSIFQIDKDLNYEHVLISAGHVPADFYNVTLMTVTFTASLVGLLVSLWSATKKKPFGIRVFLSSILIAFFLSYALTVATRMPKFWVSINESPVVKIPSFWLVWVCALPLILFIFAVYFALNCFGGNK